MPPFDLIYGLAAGTAHADRAYDAGQFFQRPTDQGDDPIVPPRRHQKRPRGCDESLYKVRNRVRRFSS